MCGTPQRSRSTVTSRRRPGKEAFPARGRSEEHTSELQSQSNLVCRLLLEKKKTNPITINSYHNHTVLGRPRLQPDLNPNGGERLSRTRKPILLDSATHHSLRSATMHPMH